MSKYTINDLLKPYIWEKGNLVKNIQSDELDQMIANGSVSKHAKEWPYFVQGIWDKGGSVSTIRLHPMVNETGSKHGVLFLDWTPSLKADLIDEDEMDVFQYTFKHSYDDEYNPTSSCYVQLNKQLSNNTKVGSKGLLLYEQDTGWCFKYYVSAPKGVILYSKYINNAQSVYESKKDLFTRIEQPSQKLIEKYEKDYNKMFSDIRPGSQSILVTPYYTFNDCVVVSSGSNRSGTSTFVQLFQTKQIDDDENNDNFCIQGCGATELMQSFESTYLVIKNSDNPMDTPWQEIMKNYIPVVNDYQIVKDKDTGEEGMACSVRKLSDSDDVSDYKYKVVFNNNNSPYIKDYDYLSDMLNCNLEVLDKYYPSDEEDQFDTVRKYCGLVPGACIKFLDASDNLFYGGVPDHIRKGTIAYVITNQHMNHMIYQDHRVITVMAKTQDGTYVDDAMKIPRQPNTIKILKQTNIKNKAVFAKITNFEKDFSNRYARKAFNYPDARSAASEFWERNSYNDKDCYIPQFSGDDLTLYTDDYFYPVCKDMYIQKFLKKNGLGEEHRNSIEMNKTFERGVKSIIEQACNYVSIEVNKKILTKIKTGDVLEVIDPGDDPTLQKGDIVKVIERDMYFSIDCFYVVIQRTGEEYNMVPDDYDYEKPVQLKFVK